MKYRIKCSWPHPLSILLQFFKIKHKGEYFVLRVMNTRIKEYSEQLNKLKGKFLKVLSVCLSLRLLQVKGSCFVTEIFNDKSLYGTGIQLY